MLECLVDEIKTWASKIAKKILSVPSWNSEKKAALAFDMSMLWDRACDKGNMELQFTRETVILGFKAAPHNHAAAITINPAFTFYLIKSWKKVKMRRWGGWWQLPQMKLTHNCLFGGGKVKRKVSLWQQIEMSSQESSRGSIPFSCLPLHPALVLE